MTGLEAARHWDDVYATRAVSTVSWYQPTAAMSLQLLAETSGPADAVIDIGAGASTLVDDLLGRGWSDVTLLDVSHEALDQTRTRLADRADVVSYVVADVRQWLPPRQYDVWHDRAVFHFLVEPTDRDGYVATAGRAVPAGGVVVLGTFAPDGPTSCSGLPTARYDAAQLADVFAGAFTLERSEREEHVTPSGVVQPFTWVVLRRI